jgi:hypothetical protein
MLLCSEVLRHGIVIVRCERQIHRTEVSEEGTVSIM